MKKLLLAVTICLFIVLAVNAQKKSTFEGTVIFTISFEGTELPPEAIAMLKDAQTVMYIKDDRCRVDMTMPMQSTSTIVDNKNKNSVTLMDIMGRKFLIRMKEADIKKEEDSAPETIIKYTDETKVIAGYKCKKAEITIKGKQEKAIDVYYTDEIQSNDIKPVYKGLKGFPLEYLVNQGGMEMKFTAKSISKETIADSKFEIPKEGYSETTVEELQKTVMKQMGAQ